MGRPLQSCGSMRHSSPHKLSWTSILGPSASCRSSSASGVPCFFSYLVDRSMLFFVRTSKAFFASATPCWTPFALLNMLAWEMFLCPLCLPMLYIGFHRMRACFQGMWSLLNFLSVTFSSGSCPVCSHLCHRVVLHMPYFSLFHIDEKHSLCTSCWDCINCLLELFLHVFEQGFIVCNR